ncbi:MAG TPA: acyl-CoA dehydrogenase family protein [Polyangia bacterium]|jgi:alkylation response protein AidB-like acyl-CoA dehydrogenase
MSDTPFPPDPFQRAHRAHADLAANLQLAGRDRAEAELVAEIRRSVRRFAQTIDSRAIERDHVIPPSILAGAAELGLFGLTIPEEYGGTGLSLQGSCGVIEELAEFDRSVATSIGLHNGLGLRGLIRYGGEHLKRRYLPDMAAGKTLAAFAATEAGAGSDLAAIRASAMPDPQQPDRLVLNGEKIFITNARYASLFTLVLFTPGLGGKKKGHSLVIAPQDVPWFTIGREEDKLGLRGSSTASINYADSPLPADHVIGEPGKGITLMNRVLAWGRTLMAAGCLGGGSQALTLAAGHVATRRQFGRTLGEFELVRRQLAEMRARLYLAHSLVRAASRLCDQLEEGAAWETAAAKILCSEQAFTVIDTALQLHGGAGFIEETGVARALRDCRVTRIFEGANDVLRLHLAGEALTWPLADIAALPPLAPALALPLREAAAENDAHLGELLAAIGNARRAHGMKVIERQATLARLGTMALAVYSARVTLLRSQGALADGGADVPEVDWALAACEDAAAAFAAASRGLADPRAEIHDRVARRELARVAQ